jgi:hypothetical protein
VRAVLALVTMAATSARAETWHTYAAFRNDAFSELELPLDDQGFTHDNVFQLVRADGDLGFGGRAVHRWITSTIDRRRWDQVDVVALAEYRVPLATPLPLRIDTQGRLGPTLGGNFGGRYLQNGWHALTNSGPTLDEGLANDYPGSRELGVLAGARARAQLGDAGVHGYAVIDGQLALAAGVSSLEAMLGGTAGTRHVGAHVEVALTGYRVSDELLALPGGYGAGWQLEWRAGVHVAWSRFRLTYQFRANEGGSGEPLGVIAFQSRR